LISAYWEGHNAQLDVESHVKVALDAINTL